jgi:hypothetical protein
MRNLFLIALLSAALPALASPECESDGLWGCCAMLCMGGPTQPDCIAPIARMKRGNTPTCPSMALEQTPFDPCPAGTAPAGWSYIKVSGSAVTPANLGGYNLATAGTVYQDVDRPDAVFTESVVTERVCVGGQSTAAEEFVESRGIVPVMYFERVFVQAPQTDKPYLLQGRNKDGSAWSVRFNLP